MPRYIKVLAIDGGGARGLVPALILQRVEEKVGKPVHQIFDIVSGASTGAVLSLLLTRPDQQYTAERAAQVYFTDAWKFFQRTWLRALWTLDGLIAAKYPASTVVNTMKEFLGETATLKDALTDVLIPTYELRGTFPRVRLFTRDAAQDPDRNYFMWQVARAATAAPTYFPVAEIANRGNGKDVDTVDGGVYVNNPSLLALTYAMEKFGATTEAGAVEHLLLSIGTGWFDEPISASKARNWGLLGWGTKILDVTFEGQTDLASQQVTDLLPAMGALRRYWRLQPELPEPYPLDNTTPEGMTSLRDTTLRFLDTNDAEIERMCTALRDHIFLDEAPEAAPVVVAAGQPTAPATPPAPRRRHSVHIGGRTSVKK